jgi:predicted metal-dependent hydrolase
MMSSTTSVLFLPYGERRIRCSVRRSQLRKKNSVSIHVEPDGCVVMDAPVQASDAEIRFAAMKRVAWIYKRLVEVERRLKFVTPREYVSGETAYYMGRRYRLKVLKEMHDEYVRVRGGYIEVGVQSYSTAKVKKVLSDWYRDRARIVLLSRLVEVSRPLRWVKDTPPISLRIMKVQWGSCSPRGRITLNPSLVRAPRECIDYVLLHELCHLREHNHGTKFYRLLDVHLPGWKHIKLRLDDMADGILAC